MSYDDYPDEAADWHPSGSRGRQTGGRGKQGGGKGRDLGDYTEVKYRIQEFYAKYPEGSLVTSKVRILDKVDPPRVMVQALAFRNPTDELPGVGTSWMELPGKTPYTRGSEVENTETSAWGRAIASLGIAVDKGIATADEIRNQHGDGEEATQDGQTATDAPAPVERQESTTAALPDNALPGTETTVPRSLDSKTDAEVSEMSYDVFKELAREKFIPSATISSTAKRLFGEEATSLRALTNDERKRLWHVLVTGELPSDPASTESPAQSE